jgi:hypothetical protein
MNIEIVIAILYILTLNLTLSFKFKPNFKKRFTSSSSFLKMRTCFSNDPDDEDINKYSKMLMGNAEIVTEYNSISDYDKPLYTLIWYDCDKCRELLGNFKSLDLKHVYINGGYYFYDTSDVNSDFQSPILYKDEVFIGDTLFDIYQELYK